MISITATHSAKKSHNFDSDCYSATMTIELGNDSTASQIQERLHKAYALLRESVQQEFDAQPEASRRAAAEQPLAQRASGHSPRIGNGKRNGHATAAQQRCLHALLRNRNELRSYLEEHWGVVDPAELSVKTASEAISSLKEGQR